MESHHCFIRRFLVSLAFCSLAALSPGPASAAGQKKGERVLDVVETVRLNLPEGARKVQLWIPKLANTPHQSAQLLEVHSPWPHRITSDPDFGNELLFLEAKRPKSRTVEVSVRYRVARKEQQAEAAPGAPAALYLEPRGLVVVNDEIRRIARETAQGLDEPWDKARALYHYVFSRMAYRAATDFPMRPSTARSRARYDKSGQGWGRGDVVYACKTGKGNCTDFHSLFIALAMAEKIPARFRIGYPLPSAPEGEVQSPYHCWAEFYVEGRGWIPVDISEAWKHPARADYYFGNLDEDRVLVSTGREIRLSPKQKGEPLNYLVRPYAEADGKPLYDLELKRSYKNLEPQKS